MHVSVQMSQTLVILVYMFLEELSERMSQLLH